MFARTTQTYQKDTPMNHTLKTLTIMLATTVALSACHTASKKLTPPSKPMTPASLPEPFKVGDEWNIVRSDGGERHYTVTKVDTPWFTVRANKETETVLNRNFLTPAKSWTGSNAGVMRVVAGDPDALFPLVVGNTAKFTDAGKNKKASWDGSGNTCTVKGTGSIKVKAGDFDAYTIVCKRGIGKFSSNTTYYYAPGPQMVVKYRKTGFLANSWELVSFKRN